MRWLGFWAFLGVAVCGHAQQFSVDEFRTFRNTKGLSIPLWDEKLASSCLVRAKQLAVEGLLSHDDEQGRGPGRQLIAQGYEPGVYGEVLGAGAEAEAVWKAWLASPSHRAVLVDPEWKTWGWGAVASGSTVVWVVRFWRP